MQFSHLLKVFLAFPFLIFFRFRFFFLIKQTTKIAQKLKIKLKRNKKLLKSEQNIPIDQKNHQEYEYNVFQYFFSSGLKQKIRNKILRIKITENFREN